MCKWTVITTGVLLICGSGCGDDGRPPGGGDEDSGTEAGEDAGLLDGGRDAGVRDGGSDAGEDAGPAPDAGPLPDPTPTCPGDALQLDVQLMGGTTAPSSRLVVMWFQLDDDARPPPVIAYDRAFDGTETTIDIPLADIGPPSHETFLCDRDCSDPIACPCLGDPRVAIAYVFVVTDPDGSGAIELADLADAETLGLAWGLLGFGSMRYVTPPASPTWLGSIFPEGVEAGRCPYRIIEGTGFDKLGRTGATDRLDLNVCAADATACDLPTPNLT